MAFKNIYLGIFIWALFSWTAVLCLENETEAEELSVLEKWQHIDKSLKDSVRSMIKKAMPMFLESSNSVDISSQCKKNLLQLVTGIRSIKKWAFEFLDANGKLPDQTLSGTLTYLGVYDECLKAKAPEDSRTSAVPFRGKYCMANVRFPLPPKTKRYSLSSRVDELRNFTGTEIVKELTQRAHYFYFIPIKIGVCIPSGCTQEDLSQILKFAAKKAHLEVDVSRCEVKEDKVHLCNVHVAAITVCAILGFLVFIGTVIDQGTDAAFQSKTRQVFLCFSSSRSFKLLTTTCTSESSLRCLHGMRFLSIMWMIYGNAYFYGAYFISAYRELFGMKNVITGSFAQTVTNSSMVSDTFFFMAGLLMSYAVMKFVTVEKQNFNIFFIVFHKLWRLVPLYYFVLLFGMLVPLFGSGPMHHEIMEKSVQTCYDHWWRNLIFINNFYSLGDMCWMHTWFISCYLQLFILSLIVLSVMVKYEKIGVIISILMIILSVFYIGFITYKERPAISIFLEFIDPVDRDLGMVYIFGNAIARAGPYFIGFLVGYILVKKPAVKIPKMFQLLGWIVAACSSLYSVYITGYYYNVKPAGLLDIFAYACIHHVTFALGLAWMILCCATGHAGIIDKFLRWKVWMPLSRLTFLIYLIEPMVQTAYISVVKTTQEYSHFHMINNAFGFLCISGLLALLLYVLVEGPLQSLELMLLENLFSKPIPKDIKKRNSFATEDFQMDFKQLNGLRDLSQDSKGHMENKI